MSNIKQQGRTFGPALLTHLQRELLNYLSTRHRIDTMHNTKSGAPCQSPELVTRPGSKESD
jgi:hypothetical protein